MFLVVTLEKCVKNIVVPIKWVQSIDIDNLINGGINLSQTHIVFYSTKKEDPDFSLECDRVNFIDGNARGCFYGRIIEFFGKELFLTNMIA